jgi:hypothetical protein
MRISSLSKVEIYNPSVSLMVHTMGCDNERCPRGLSFYLNKSGVELSSLDDDWVNVIMYDVLARALREKHKNMLITTMTGFITFIT